MTSVRRTALAAACLCAAFAAAHSGTPPRAVESPQPLLMEALREGRAHGVIVGPIARAFAEMFRTAAELRYTVEALEDLGGGCRRLSVAVEQDGVWDRNSTTVATAPEPRRLTYLVSMCPDGSPASATPAGPAPKAPQ
jgi:hypothetical protein